VPEPSISVVIPVYNEEPEVRGVVAAVRAWLESRRGDWEIVVVDNASTDRTVQALEPLLEPGRVRLLRNDRNRGKGYSVRRGMLEARGDLRLMCDADCTPSLRSLGKMVEQAERLDVVVGSRVAPGAEVARQQPLRRRIVGFGFLFLTRAVMGRLARDVYCGFKLWRAPAARDVFARTRLDGWTFDAEALAMARALGYRVDEVGIAWNNRPASRLSIHRVLLPVVGELFSARRHVRREARRGAAPGAPPEGEALVPHEADTRA
jgi:dolichyl-phosphate beta-glucosyltransferase